MGQRPVLIISGLCNAPISPNFVPYIVSRSSTDARPIYDLTTQPRGDLVECFAGHGISRDVLEQKLKGIKEGIETKIYQCNWICIGADSKLAGFFFFFFL